VALPFTAKMLAPGPEMVMLSFTSSSPLLSVIAPVTEKLIVSPSAAAASASRNRQPAPGQFPALAAPSPLFVTVHVVAASTICTLAIAAQTSVIRKRIRVLTGKVGFFIGLFFGFTPYKGKKSGAFQKNGFAALNR
jgi:hypothetical protein